MNLLGYFRRPKFVQGQVPTTLVRRKLLYYSKDISSDELSEVAETLLAAERYSDAISFLKRAGKVEELESLAQKAVKLGDLFLYDSCRRALGLQHETGDLSRLAERSLALGRLSDSARAFRAAGNTKRAEDLEAQWAEFLGEKPATEAVSDDESSR